MATEQELMQALRNAHEAGDTETARRIAAMMPSKPAGGEGFNQNPYAGKNAPVSAPKMPVAGNPALDLLSGSTEFPRSVLRMALGKDVQEKVMPKMGDPNSGWTMLGNVLDPSAALTGQKATQFLGKVPGFAKGGWEKMTGVAPAARNVVSGATVGAGMGYAYGDDPTTGAMMGGLIPAAAGATKAAGHYLGRAKQALTHEGRLAGHQADIRQGFSDVLPSHQRDQLATELLSAQPGESVADVVARLNMGTTGRVGSPLVKSQAVVSQRPAVSDTAKSIESMKAAARERALRNFAGTDEDMQIARQLRDEVTAPQRESVMFDVDQGQRIPGLERDIMGKQGDVGDLSRMRYELLGDANNLDFVPVPGMPRVSSRYSPTVETFREGAGDVADVQARRIAERNQLQQELDGMVSRGLKPLDPTMLLSGITRRMESEGTRMNPTALQALGNVRNLIRRNLGADTPINVEDLYTLRKNAGSIIRAAAKENSDWDDKYTAGLLMDVQGSIDDAIEDSIGNTGKWRNYLKDYSDASQGINQMQIGNELVDALRSGLDKERPAAFAAKARQLETEIGQRLTPQQQAQVDNVTQSLRQQEMVSELGGDVDVKSILAEKSVEPSIPSVLWRPATITRYLFKQMRQNEYNQAVDDMAKMMLTDPAGFANTYLKDVSKTDANALRKWLGEGMRSSQYPAVGTMTTPNQGEENAP
jgi:hypothetical protein